MWNTEGDGKWFRGVAVDTDRLSVFCKVACFVLLLLCFFFLCLWFLFGGGGSGEGWFLSCCCFLSPCCCFGGRGFENLRKDARGHGRVKWTGRKEGECGDTAHEEGRNQIKLVALGAERQGAGL